MSSILRVKDLKKIYGGKGFYLLWVKNIERVLGNKIHVPDFVIIPVYQCKKYLKEKVYNEKEIENLLINLPKTKYSVRSGAEKSLPGLMDTKLFILKRDLHKNIEEVFKSFLNIPEDIRKELDGTAVVVQCMAKVLPKNKVAVGVVFPKIKDDLSVSLEFQYSSRVGDDIVAGKKEEDGIIDINIPFPIKKVPKKGTPFYKTPLIDIFYRYATSFYHPPEFEIIIDFTKKKVFFLQARDYKMSPKEAKLWKNWYEELEIKHMSKPIMALAEKHQEIEIKESPIIEGVGEGVCKGRFVRKKLKSPYILYMKDGVSLNWIDAISDDKCVGIAFSNGSLHCHCVVLAKGYGKAYIKINEDDAKKLFHKGCLTLIEGRVYSGDIQVDNINIQESTSEKTIVVPKLVREKINRLNINSIELAREEIINYKLLILDRIPEKEIQQVLNSIVTRFILWGTLACIGESRHIHLSANCASIGIKRNNVFKYIDFGFEDKNTEKILEGLVFIKDKYSYIYAPTTEVLYKGVDKKNLYNIMNFLELLFKNPSEAIVKAIGATNILHSCEKAGKEFNVIKKHLGHFHSGYGGIKWSKIAKATKDLIETLGKKIELSKILALLNKIEALQHNNAVFFNKFIEVSPIMAIYNNFNKGEDIFLEYISKDYGINISEISGKKLQSIDSDNLPLRDVFPKGEYSIDKPVEKNPEACF